MSYESVRLVHSNGLPHTYVLNQIYEPSEASHRSKGVFFLLIAETPASSGAFVSSLATAIIRDYYRQGSSDGIDGFERALLRVNEIISTTPHSQLDGAIVLSHQNEIHLSFIGNVHAILGRENETLSLAGNEPTAQSPVGFSIITSGELHTNDILALTVRCQSASHESLQDTLQFSRSHQPHYELGRAYARALKDRGEGDFESIITVFSANTHGVHTIALNKSLETFEERLDRAKTKAGVVINWLAPYWNKMLAQTKRLAPVIVSRTPAPSAPVESEVTPPTRIAPRLDGVSEDVKPVSNDGFVVKTYKSLTGQNHPDLSESIKADTVKQKRTWWPILRLNALKSRTFYLLGSIVAVIAIIGVIYNQLAGPTKKDVSLTERDAIVAAATNLAREADGAIASDDTAKAIRLLMEIEVNLKKIDPEAGNETSKALNLRATELLAKLTDTKKLATDPNPIQLSVPATHIVTAGTMVIVIGSDPPIQKMADGKLTPIIGDIGTFVDAAVLGDGKTVALLTKRDTSFQVWKLDTASESVKEIKRADNKPWPESQLIATFESNIYLIGSKITKAIPSGDTYRVVTFLGEPDTHEVTSIVTIGSVFYALENHKQLVRIAANTPKTTVKLFGIPDTLWPERFSKLIPSQKEDRLYIWSQNDNRVIATTIDGGYKGQYKLLTDTAINDCGFITTGFVCANQAKQIVVFPLPKP